MTEEVKGTRKPLSNGFIPALKGKKVIIRLTSGDHQRIIQLSLKPGDEETKKKGCGQFWK